MNALSSLSPVGFAVLTSLLVVIVNPTFDSLFLSPCICVYFSIGNDIISSAFRDWSRSNSGLNFELLPNRFC